ncbi:prephenate dehydratase [Bacillus atrophaeus]|uniref:Prephenate dehydratase n=1 Tax=Bacillus atrophaeus (strain 1942) TaxID=720555 RepID=A0ABM5LZE9_BACA1|nr:prephenate dehydratase [Bacillus atrophaeus]AMR61968.1 prephenate dehydratase [Bacillus subtilis subsp. globigii]ADP33274.1 prephenate dehydratase [Bacillus atrophaeus 1942]AIK48315.1 prephenate dehydratase family protein [Bacillus atrophaeus subsp. globigii]EIM12426.1 prephenate dehydratase [Bacillus atrophaeus C89]KFK81716.1 prephenate dehydratase family protein [Bacillus atrophaeus]
MKVGYLGPEATFTHLAVSSCFQNDVTHVAYHTIPECMDAAVAGEIDFAFVPLENALEGSVNLTIDYLIHEQPLPIVGEMTLPIHQHLLVHPSRENKWESLGQIYSHSHAIAQCHKFLHKHFKTVPYEYAKSTGAAAKYVSENPQLNIGVIANEMAAATYELKIVKHDIQDYRDNHTRFVILSPDENAGYEVNPHLVSRPKTTLMVTLPQDDQSGALHRVLSAFSWRNLNLSKIESRPTKTGLGHYFFIIDIEMALDAVLIPGAIQELETLGCSVKLLGNYQSYKL